MIIIGEKINATIPGVKRIIQERNSIELVELARSQAGAGSDFIDVNVGTGAGSRNDEIDSMRWAVETIQEKVDTPLCIDSADPGVLEAGLGTREGRPSMINSTKAEDSQLDVIVPLAEKYQAFLVGLAMDESGIPKAVAGRVRACGKIAAACEKCGVEMERVFFDPLVIPVSTDITQGMVTLETIRRVKEAFPGAKTIMGLSNVSHGLPERARLNAAFLHMAIAAGLDAALVDPLNAGLMAAVKTADVLVGKDRHCRKFIRTFRK